jgi:hypothetical protein
MSSSRREIRINSSFRFEVRRRALGEERLPLGN